MKKFFLIPILLISISTQAQKVVKGYITEVKSDTVIVAGEKFIIPGECFTVGQYATFEATNISDRRNRRKVNSRRLKVGAAEFPNTKTQAE